MGGYYYPRRRRSPSYGGYGSHERILELILRQGDQSAQSRLQGADILGGLVQNLGQQGAQVVDTIGKEKAAKKQAEEMGKRDAAWVAYVESGEWQKDPTGAYATAQRMFGPDGDKKFAGLQSFQALMGEKRDHEADKKHLGTVIRGLKGQGDAVWQRWWPTLRGAAEKVFPGQVPEQYDPSMRGEYEGIGAALLGEKPAEGFTLGPGQQRFGPDGKPIAEVPPEAPKPEGPRVVGRSLVGPDGKVIYRDPEPARAETERRPVQVETVDEQGRPVTRFVDPQAGASYPKPTGAGKPATGQQRKALQFFNRGKEAQEIASSLEEGGKVNPTRLRYTPGVANFTLSNEDQSYQNAQRAFTEARLRKESGAAVPQYEYDNDAKTYFAQPGDSKETIEQKRAGRNAILAGIAFESGDALREFYGEEAEGMVERYKAQSKGGLPRRVGTEAEYNALPSGTVYIGPDGKPRRKR